MTRPDLTQHRRWYVFHTYSRSEQRVCSDIEDLGYNVYLPLAKRWRSRRGYKSPYEEPLFKSYGFVLFDITTPGWGSILDSKHLLGLLPTPSAPVAVDNHFIASLQLAEKMGMFDKTRPPEVGMMVELGGSPFAGFVGKVKSADKRQRVRLLVSLLGRMVHVDAPVESLRSAHA